MKIEAIDSETYISLYLKDIEAEKTATPMMVIVPRNIEVMDLVIDALITERTKLV